MLYAAYDTDRKVFFVSETPLARGVKGKTKRAIWNQIRCNAAYARDMAVRGYVGIYYTCASGAWKHVKLYTNGKRVVHGGK